MSSSMTSLIQTRSNLPAIDTPRLNVVSAVIFLVPLLLGALATWSTFSPVGVIVGLLLGLLLAQAPKIARQWERAIVLRLGRYVGYVVRGCSGSFPSWTPFPHGWTNASSRQASPLKRR